VIIGKISGYNFLPCRVPAVASTGHSEPTGLAFIRETYSCERLHQGRMPLKATARAIRPDITTDPDINKVAYFSPNSLPAACPASAARAVSPACAPAIPPTIAPPMTAKNKKVIIAIGIKHPAAVSRRLKISMMGKVDQPYLMEGRYSRPFSIASQQTGSGQTSLR